MKIIKTGLLSLVLASTPLVAQQDILGTLKHNEAQHSYCLYLHIPQVNNMPFVLNFHGKTTIQK